MGILERTGATCEVRGKECDVRGYECEATPYMWSSAEDEEPTAVGREWLAIIEALSPLLVASGELVE